MDKKVIQRIIRILNTLYNKFGPTLDFTAKEVGELACTTTESTLRILSNLRQKGVIKTNRGQICIIRPEELRESENENIWL